MQAKRAEELRQEWGSKPCSHPSLDREYYLGSNTGDYVCTKCGKNFTRGEAEDLRKGERRE